MIITSRQNPRVKEAAALRNRKQRDATGLAIVDGPRETLRAIASGVVVQRVFVCGEHAAGEEASRAVAEAEQAGAERIEVSPEVFDKVAYGDRTDGVVSLVEARARPLGDLALPEAPLVCVIERVEKPGNLGALLRSADGAGVDAVVLADPVIDLFNPNVIRASVGAVFKPNIAVAAADDVLAWLSAAGVPAYTARPDAQMDYYAADFTAGGAIVLGNEARGLTSLWSGPEVTAVSLPMLGVADSLNVSATAAVMFYEALRQRR